MFMPVKSYLAHPHKGEKEALKSALLKLKFCEVITAKNEDLLIVVTETENNEEDSLLKEKMEAIKSLKMLVMVSGFN